MKYQNLLWVLQSNLGSEVTLAEFVSVLEKRHISYECVKVIPFSDELPNVRQDGLTIFYGATQFVFKAFKSQRWTPGAFFDEEQFTYQAYLDHYQDNLLNSDTRVMTLTQFNEEKWPADELFFIRPNADLKEFTGEVISFADYKTWYLLLSRIDEGLSPETLIAVSEPKQIIREWRLFLVNGNVSTGSLYREYGRAKIKDDVPQPVVKFAEEMADIWSPHPIFAMDVAEVNGDYKIIELGCVNGCGVYAADIEKFVVDVSDALIKGLK